MDKKTIIVIALIVLIASLAVGMCFYWQFGNKTYNFFKYMKLESSEFTDNGQIPEKYTCDGENINPPLIISEVPAEVKSLALMVNDSDAPSGDWLHWLVWNISPETKKIEQGLLPSGAIEGANDFGLIGYGGPCPPTGSHHYIFKLIALNKAIGLPAGATIREFQEAITDSVLGEAKLTGSYQKK